MAETPRGNLATHVFKPPLRAHASVHSDDLCSSRGSTTGAMFVLSGAGIGARSWVWHAHMLAARHPAILAIG